MIPTTALLFSVLTASAFLQIGCASKSLVSRQGRAPENRNESGQVVDKGLPIAEICGSETSVDVCEEISSSSRIAKIDDSTNGDNVKKMGIGVYGKNRRGFALNCDELTTPEGKVPPSVAIGMIREIFAQEVPLFLGEPASVQLRKTKCVLFNIVSSPDIVGDIRCSELMYKHKEVYLELGPIETVEKKKNIGMNNRDGLIIQSWSWKEEKAVGDNWKTIESNETECAANSVLILESVAQYFENGQLEGILLEAPQTYSWRIPKTYSREQAMKEHLAPLYKEGEPSAEETVYVIARKRKMEQEAVDGGLRKSDWDGWVIEILRGDKMQYRKDFMEILFDVE